MNSLLWLVLCGFPTTNAASHSLKYFYTAVTAGIDFPEFTTVGLVDDEPFTYYDSNIRRETPKTEWIKKNVGEDYWDKNSEASLSAQQTFKENIGILMKRFNQTQGVHTVQYMYGCEWDDETGATGGFDQYGYDGEDFIALDTKTWRYIAPGHSGEITARTWNHHPAELEYEKQYLTQECVYWLKKYVSYGKSTLERREGHLLSCYLSCDRILPPCRHGNLEERRTGPGYGRRAGGDGAQWGRNVPDHVSPAREA
ncbi:hypothetical protein COCON_G00125590 [Conger conger]|uniref:MHC class I-like antigen recognition-like domain-containing protein n=1 Tax=Conger conger TaxID=82655 RepID=A0A9Q1HWR5_CONCO|nr:hypothetical protein COCON_G00125590 [Conger conger]